MVCQWDWSSAKLPIVRVDIWIVDTVDRIAPFLPVTPTYDEIMICGSCFLKNCSCSGI